MAPRPAPFLAAALSARASAGFYDSAAPAAPSLGPSLPGGGNDTGTPSAAPTAPPPLLAWANSTAAAIAGVAICTILLAVLTGFAAVYAKRRRESFTEMRDDDEMKTEAEALRQSQEDDRQRDDAGLLGTPRDGPPTTPPPAPPEVQPGGCWGLGSKSKGCAYVPSDGGFAQTEDGMANAFSI